MRCSPAHAKLLLVVLYCMPTHRPCPPYTSHQGPNRPSARVITLALLNQPYFKAKSATNSSYLLTGLGQFICECHIVARVSLSRAASYQCGSNALLLARSPATKAWCTTPHDGIMDVSCVPRSAWQGLLLLTGACLSRFQQLPVRRYIRSHVCAQCGLGCAPYQPASRHVLVHHISGVASAWCCISLGQAPRDAVTGSAFPPRELFVL